MLRNLIAILLSISLISSLVIANSANDIPNVFDDGTKTGEYFLEHDIKDKLKDFDPNSIFKNYQENPRETNFYTNEQNPFSDLTSRGASAAADEKNEQARIVLQSFSQKPDYKINMQEPGMKTSQEISSHAADIINHQYTGCRSTQTCKIEYTNEPCREPGGLGPTKCTKDLIVQAKPAPVDKADVVVTAQTDGWGWRSRQVSFEVDLKEGKLISSSDPRAGVSIEGSAKDINHCHTIIVEHRVEPLRPGSDLPDVQITSRPDCNNKFHTKFTLSTKGWFIGGLGAKITFSIKGIGEQTIQDAWNSSCEQLERAASLGVCARGADSCTVPGGTRIINTISIYRDCWQTTTQYNCQRGTDDGSCQSLRNQNCEQIGSKCEDERCLNYIQTYRCPKKTCQADPVIVCGDQSFCFDGNCTKPVKTASEDFQRSVSALSATADASKQNDGNFIFRGNALSCRKEPLGFLNCCSDKGWGKDIGLASCDDEEKALGYARQERRSHYVGEKCTKHLPWPMDHVCIQHRDVYCAFGSKLARIVQEQGREKQLRIGFGDGENPNCRGLKAEELQRIKFDSDSIDFSEFFEDLNQKMKMPDVGMTNDKIKEAIRRQFDEGKSHG